VPPQLWFGETTSVELGVAEVEVVDDVLVVVVVDDDDDDDDDDVALVLVVDEVVLVVPLVLVELDELDVVPPVAGRYQFSGGSPRHSPTVTGWYPLERVTLTIKAVKLMTVWRCTSWESSMY